MTLITYSSSRGVEGRCDSRCYNALNDKCTCICGGVNHKKGLQIAAEQTAKLGDEWIKSFRAAHPNETVKAQLNWKDMRPLLQIDLFPMAESSDGVTS